MSNIKGLGEKQTSLIKRMVEDNLVIRVTHDYSTMSRDRRLEDFEGDNVYESVPERLLQSLYDRGILLVHTISKCTSIDIDTFFLKKTLEIK